MTSATVRHQPATSHKRRSQGVSHPNPATPMQNRRSEGVRQCDPYRVPLAVALGPVSLEGDIR
jgi:hypothetical protein